VALDRDAGDALQSLGRDFAISPVCPETCDPRGSATLLKKRDGYRADNFRISDNSRVVGEKPVSWDLCILASKSFRDSGITQAFKSTFEVFTRVGPDNSLERLTECSIGLVTDRASNVYELFVTQL
jgi:hypothetical protein